MSIEVSSKISCEALGDFFHQVRNLESCLFCACWIQREEAEIPGYSDSGGDDFIQGRFFEFSFNFSAIHISNMFHAAINFVSDMIALDNWVKQIFK